MLESVVLALVSANMDGCSRQQDDEGVDGADMRETQPE
jgi:hypothetical protein